MATPTDPPPIRMAHAGVRMAMAIALVPAVLWLALVGLGMFQEAWCGAAALFARLGLLLASLYTAAWLLPCAAILLAPLARRRTPLTRLQCTLLAICALGIAVPALLAATAFVIPAGQCASPEKNRIPVA